MKLLKAFWFWLLVLWTLTEGILLITLRSTWSLYSPWSWIGATGLFLLVLLFSLFLRQRSLLRKMTKARPASVDAKNEEPWKQKVRADLDVIAKAVDGFVQKKCVLVMGTHRAELQSLLGAAAATNVLQREEARLSGELSALLDVYVSGNTLFLCAVDVELAHGTQPEALGDKFALVLDVLARIRPKALDSVILVNPAKVDTNLAAEIGARQQRILSATMRLLGLDLPLYALFCPGPEAGAMSLLLAQDGLGTSFALSLEKPAKELVGEGFAQLSKELDSMLDALLFRARNKQVAASDVFAVRQLMQEWERGATPLLNAVLSHYVGSERPLFRGIYLDPGISLARAAVASTDIFGSVIDFGSAEISQSVPERSVPFLKFFAEETLTARFCVRKQRKQTALTWALSLFLIFSSVLLIATALSSFTLVNSMRNAWDRDANTLRATSWDTQQTLAQWFGHWNMAFALYESLENGRPWKIAPGFFTMGDRKEQALARYDTLSKNLFVSAMRSQEEFLRNSLSDGTTLADPSVYMALRNYMSLSSEFREKVSEDSLAFILGAVLQGELELRLGHLSDTERAVFTSHVQRIAERLYPFAADMPLIEQLRIAIVEKRKESGNFDQLLAQASAIPSITLDSLGFQDDRLVKGAIEVPGAFTRRGYFEVILPAMEQGGAGKSDWVLGVVSVQSTEDLMGSEQLRALKAQYFTAYQEQWRKFLDQVAISLPSDFQASAGVLEMLASPYSVHDPKGLRAFLKGVCRQVDLRPQVKGDSASQLAPKKMAGQLKKMDKLLDKVKDMAQGETPEEAMAQYFGVPCELDSLAGKNRLDAYFKDLGQLSSMLGQANIGDKSTFEFGKSMLAGDRKNPLVHAWEEVGSLLESIPLSERPWLSAVFQTPLKNIGAMLVPIMVEQLQRDYKESVFDPYQSNLRTAYPFNRQSSREAMVEDVAAFFHPQTGGVARFLKSTEGVFVIDAGRVTSKEWNGQGLRLSSSFAESLKKSRKITEAFFGSSTQWRGYQTSIEVKAPMNASVSLSVNGQLLEVSSGMEKRITVKWPQAGGNGIELRVKTASKEFTENFMGEWSILKLTQRRGATSIPGGKEIIFSFQDRSYIIDVPIRVRFDMPTNPVSVPDMFELDMNPDVVSR